jgi:hypothetical protein
VTAFYGDFLVAEAVPFLAVVAAFAGVAFFFAEALPSFLAGVAALLVVDFFPPVEALPFFSA